jgi:hypothetical protein
MKAAILESSVVVNIAKVDDQQFAESQGWIVSETAKIGDSYDAVTGEFISPPPEPEPVPERVTMRQARLALLRQGLLSQIEDALSQLSEPDKTAATIEWEYSQTVERSKPFVQMLIPILGLTDSQADDLFRLAATL